MARNNDTPWHDARWQGDQRRGELVEAHTFGLDEKESLQTWCRDRRREGYRVRTGVRSVRFDLVIVWLVVATARRAPNVVAAAAYQRLYRGDPDDLVTTADQDALGLSRREGEHAHEALRRARERTTR
jgi:hypothetical protein